MVDKTIYETEPNVQMSRCPDLAKLQVKNSRVANIKAYRLVGRCWGKPPYAIISAHLQYHPHIRIGNRQILKWTRQSTIAL